MVDILRPVTATRTARFRGDLYKKLKAYSPAFHLAVAVPLLGQSYARFNREDPSYARVTESPLAGNLAAIVVSSYAQETNERLFHELEQAGLSLQPDSPCGGRCRILDENIEAAKRVTEAEFQILLVS